MLIRFQGVCLCSAVEGKEEMQTTCCTILPFCILRPKVAEDFKIVVDSSQCQKHCQGAVNKHSHVPGKECHHGLFRSLQKWMLAQHFIKPHNVPSCNLKSLPFITNLTVFL